MEHLLTAVQKLGKDDPIRKALQTEGIEDIYEFINLSQEDIKDLVIESDDGEKPLPRASQRKLKNMVKYARFVKEAGTSWMDINE